MKTATIAAGIVLALSPALAHAEQFRGWAAGECDGGNPTVLCTTNGTQWFRQALDGSVPAVVFYSVTATRGGKVWIAGGIHDGYAAICRSADGGATWQRQGDSAGLPQKELYKIRAAGENTVWAVGQDGAVLRTADGGATWQSLAIPGFTGHLQGLSALDANRAWVGGSESNNIAVIFRTADGGATWTRQTDGAITNMQHVLGIHAVNADTVWALGGPFHIIVSTNGGAMWQQSTGGGTLRDGNEIFVDRNGTVWAAMDSAVLWSADGGATWSSQNVPEHCMSINSPDGANVWAASTHWTGGIICHSPDGGATWTQQLFTAGTELNEVAFVPQPGAAVFNDYDGDGLTDLTVFNAASGTWYALSPSGNIVLWNEPWGWPGASVVPGDYDGDGRSDFAAYDEAGGCWYIRSAQGRLLAWALPWGGPGLRAVPGDYDGDGRSDLAVYQAAGGLWYAYSLAKGTVIFWNVTWGGPGFEPVGAP